MTHESEIFCRKFRFAVSTHRHNARNILHYLHRKDDLFKRDRCEKMVDANDERVRRFSERKPHRGRSP